MIPPPEREVCRFDGGLRMTIDRTDTHVKYRCPYCHEISYEPLGEQ